MRILEIHVDIRPVPLNTRARELLRILPQFDAVVFTSKHAERLFARALAARALKLAPHTKKYRIGPRADILKLPLRGKRVLFPRSARAPRDILSTLRARGVRVDPLVLYTVVGRKISARARASLTAGTIDRLYFKSPSGITGLLQQIPAKARKAVLATPARCIGTTTAAAARKAGWKKIFIKKVSSTA